MLIVVLLIAISGTVVIARTLLAVTSLTAFRIVAGTGLVTTFALLAVATLVLLTVAAWATLPVTSIGATGWIATLTAFRIVAGTGLITALTLLLGTIGTTTLTI